MRRPVYFSFILVYKALERSVFLDETTVPKYELISPLSFLGLPGGFFLVVW